MPDPTKFTRPGWAELVVGSLIGGAIIHRFGWVAWAVAWALWDAGWLYGRWELRRELRRKIVSALTEDPDHAT